MEKVGKPNWFEQLFVAISNLFNKMKEDGFQSHLTPLSSVSSLIQLLKERVTKFHNNRTYFRILFDRVLNQKNKEEKK